MSISITIFTNSYANAGYGVTCDHSNISSNSSNDHEYGNTYSNAELPYKHIENQSGSTLKLEQLIEILTTEVMSIHEEEMLVIEQSAQSSLLRTENRIDKLFTIAGITLAIAAILTAGGLVFTWGQFLTQKTRANKMLKKLSSKLVIVEEESKLKLQALVKTAEIEFDQIPRQVRLINMLNNKQFDSSVFYADMSQLAQNPNADLTHLAERVIGEYEGDLKEDINKFSKQILEHIKM